MFAEPHGRAVTLLLSAALAAAGPAPADTVRLRNGETVSGRIVRDDGPEVRIEVMRAGIRAELAFARGDVTSIERQAPAGDGVRARLGEAEAIEDPRARGERCLAIGREAAAAGEGNAAVEAFARAAQACPELGERADLETARVRLTQDDFRAARSLLRGLLESNPNHEQARALSRELERGLAADLEAGLTSALEPYRRGEFRAALSRLEALVRRHERAVLDPLSERVRERTGLTLPALMIDCRFRQGCPHERCRGGLIDCLKCDGGTRRKFNRPVVGPASNVPGDLADRALNAPVTYELCSACRGVGALFCETCSGTGIHFGRVTDAEREEMVRTLLLQVKRLSGRLSPTAEDTTETVTENGRTTTVRRIRPDSRTLDAAKALPALRLARCYLTEAVRIAPQTAAPGGQDLRAELDYVEDLMASLLNEKCAAYLAGACDALGVAVAGIEGRPIGRLDVTQLRRALEEAAKARHATDLILELDPALRGPLGEDVEQRQRIIDDFLRAGTAIMAAAASTSNAEKLRLDVQRQAERLALLGVEVQTLTRRPIVTAIETLRRAAGEERDQDPMRRSLRGGDGIWGNGTQSQ